MVGTWLVTRCVLAKQIQTPEVKSQHCGGARPSRLMLLQLHISKTSGLGVCVLHKAKEAFLISWQELIANIVHGERFGRGAAPGTRCLPGAALPVLPRLQEARRVFQGKIPPSGECLPRANCHQLLHEEPQQEGVSLKHLQVGGTVWVVTSGLGGICPQPRKIVMACVPRWDGRGLPALTALK